MKSCLGTQQSIGMMPTESTASIPSVQERLAHIVSVSGSSAIALLDKVHSQKVEPRKARIEMGALMKISTPHSMVMCLVSGISCPVPESGSTISEIELVELSLTGEIATNEPTIKPSFHRGVAHLPSVGDAVHFANRADLELVYSPTNAATVEVGQLYQDSNVPARLLINDLLRKHFIIVGTTGCGKSSAIRCILDGILRDHSFARIVVLDIHDEYRGAFGNMAEQINPSSFRLPFWLMNFEELTFALTTCDEEHALETEILADAILAAKRRYSDAQSGRLRRASEASGITVDTPTPFRLSDATSYIDERLGRLEKTQGVHLYRRLKARIESLVGDPRFNFMFGATVIEDTMGEVLGRLFRVPVGERPVAVLNLASLPPEILDIVISVISRLAFDLGVWSAGSIPMLLVCEEAHRYAPSSMDGKFVPTRAALARIAKEGRKHGVSLGLVTQRPSELDQTILSQCSTIIAMRLATERDQHVVRANTHDGAHDLLDYLPLLEEREAIILGQGVIMPMRIKFRDIGSANQSVEELKEFSSAWKDPGMDQKGMDSIVKSWRQVAKVVEGYQSADHRMSEN